MLALHGGCSEDDSGPTVEQPDPGSLMWAVAAGGVEDDECVAAAANADGILVAGGFGGEAAFGRDEPAPVNLTSAGYEEAFLALYGADGALLWARSDGGESADRAEGVAMGSDGGSAFVTGFFSTEATFGAGEAKETVLTAVGSLDMFLARYDTADGSLLWAKRAGSFEGHDFGYSVARAPDEGAFVVGSFTSGALFGLGEDNQTTLASAGFADVFLARYASDGTLAWVEPAGGTERDIADGVASSPSGAAFVVGSFEGTAAFGDGPEEIASAGGMDCFLARYGADGTLGWVTRMGGTGDDEATWVGVSETGDVFIVGSFSGTAEFGTEALVSTGGLDVFVALFADDGSLIWAISAGGPDDDWAQGATIGQDDGILVTGSFGQSATFGEGEAETTLQPTGGTSDLFVASYDADGGLHWAGRAGGSGTDTGHAAVRLGDGSFVVVGRFGASAVFGSEEAEQTTLVSEGGADAFLARFVP